MYIAKLLHDTKTMLYSSFLFIKLIKIICIALPLLSKQFDFDYSSSKNNYFYEIADFQKSLVFEVEKKSEPAKIPDNLIENKTSNRFQNVVSYKNYLVGGLLFVLISTNVYHFYRIRFYKKYIRKRNLEIKRLRDRVRYYKNLPSLNFSHENVILENQQLNERQKEIVLEILKGLTNAEIAGKLFIAETTVKYHIKNIYKIYNVKNRSQLYKIFTAVPDLNAQKIS